MIERILNLYGGVGGNRKLWQNVRVTMVEKDEKIAATYQALNPEDIVIIGDAHEYLLKHFQEFDLVWSSPPCQGNTKMIRSGRNHKPRFPDLRLYEEIIFLEYNFPGLWVVENVIPYYRPLIKPTAKIERHLFWANFPIKSISIPKFKGFIGRQNANDKLNLQDWLGLHYDGHLYYEKNHCVTQVLRNCVHPKIGLSILQNAIEFNTRLSDIKPLFA